MTVKLRIVAEDTAEPVEGVRVDATLWGEDGGDGGFAWAVTNAEGIAVFEKARTGVASWGNRPIRYQIYLNSPKFSRYKWTAYQTPETWLTVQPDGSYHPTECILRVATSGQKDFDIAARIVYQDLMLIGVAPHGICAIVFDVTPERLDYRFRYQNVNGGDLQTGTGQLSEPEKFFIEAGKIMIGWSKENHNCGYIYYTPEWLFVNLGHAEDFEDRRDSQGILRKRLDLSRFLLTRPQRKLENDLKG